jgi:PKD repeat protein
MKNIFFVFSFLTIISFYFLSCEETSNEPKCSDPKPNEPSFSQDKYHVHAGDTVNFTYNGPEQPAGVEYIWTFDGGIPETAGGKVASTVYYSSGSYNVELAVKNCNEDSPFIRIEPCVIVQP